MIEGYAGKQVVVTGCHSGIGACVAERLIALGAMVHGLDIAAAPDLPLASFQRFDLRDASAVDRVAASFAAPVDALFNCAGVSQSVGLAAIDVMTVNFVGTRALTERLLPRMPRGGAVVTIASSAGYGWPHNLAVLRELVATRGTDDAIDWCRRQSALIGKGYNFSKEALIVWTMMMGPRTIEKGVRINCICPGPTDTPMLDGIIADIGADKVDAYAWPIGRRSTPDEQAGPLIFLNSPAASYINGHALNVDGGLHGAAASGEVDLASLLVSSVNGKLLVHRADRSERA